MLAEYGVPPPGYRLPEATHVGCVRLSVSNLQRSLAYYEQVIGLRALRQDGAAALLAPHDDDAPLIELHAGAVRPVRPHGRLGLYHFAILVPDRAALGRFVAHLADTGTRMASADHRVSEALYLWDPDGLGIEVYADRPRSEWRTRNGELMMATEPLDIAGLARASDGALWQGLPNGTVMGHVHLHVGSLERAEALYHAGLGLDKTAWSYPGALFMSAGGYHHHLGTNTWAAGAPPASEEDARLLEWELVLPGSADINAAAASISAAGCAVTEEGNDRIATDDWGITVRLTKRD